MSVAQSVERPPAVDCSSPLNAYMICIQWGSIEFAEHQSVGPRLAHAKGDALFQLLATMIPQHLDGALGD